MRELIKNARPYAKKLLIGFSALFAIGFIWLALTFFSVIGSSSIYLGPVAFFACVFFAVILWIVFAIGQDAHKAPKHRRPTWSQNSDNTTRGAQV